MTANTQPPKGVSTQDARQHEIEKDYGRAVIDDCGAWRWSLSVEEDGVVRASKAIPHDGVRAFSTKDTAHSRTSRRHGSQFDLSPAAVVARYCDKSRTPHSVEELLEDVQTARRARGVHE